MAKKMEKEKEEEYVMICPKCKSPDVGWDKSNPVQPAMGMPVMYICNRCGHSGYTFPEVPVSEIEEFEEEAKKEGLIDLSVDKTPKVDTRYGTFVVRVLWKIFAPILILSGIFLLFREPISGTILTVFGLVILYVTYFKKRKLKDD